MKLIELKAGEILARGKDYLEYTWTYNRDHWIQATIPYIIFTTLEYKDLAKVKKEYEEYIVKYLAIKEDCLLITYRSNYTFGFMAREPFDLELRKTT